MLHRSNTGIMSVLSALLVLTTGCAAVGDLLFSPHPASLRKLEPKLSLTADTGGDCVDKPVTTRAIPPAVVGVAVTALKTLLEKEGQRYKATYSAGASDDLLVTKCIRLKHTGLVRLEMSLEGGAIAERVTDGRFTVRGTKSKIVSLPWRTLFNRQNLLDGETWSSKVGNLIGLVNPLMFVHFLWGLLDDDLYKVDFAAKIKVEMIDSASRKVTTVETVIPLGKFSIDEIADNGGGVRPVRSSSYFPKPKGSPALSNVVVSVVEANDLGDTIGEGAELVGKNEKSITDWVKGLLGLE